jgi:hypothetical protein
MAKCPCPLCVMLLRPTRMAGVFDAVYVTIVT